MTRGTTPTLEFTLPFEAECIAEVSIAFSQQDQLVLDKSLADCTVEEYKLLLRLSQEDTLALEEDVVTEIQLRLRTVSGDALASGIVPVATQRILKDGVI